MLARSASLYLDLSWTIGRYDSYRVRERHLRIIVFIGLLCASIRRLTRNVAITY